MNVSDIESSESWRGAHEMNYTSRSSDSKFEENPWTKGYIFPQNQGFAGPNSCPAVSYSAQSAFGLRFDAVFPGSG